MVQSNASTPRQYLDEIEPDRRAEIERIREILFEAVPNAREDIAYGMLIYDAAGTPLAGLAAQKRHLSLYLDPELLEPYRDQLAGLDMGKSCIRFKRADDLPHAALREILSAGAGRTTVM